MKVRIRYMYEKSTNSYLSLLFESDSIAEFLNQAVHLLHDLIQRLSISLALGVLIHVQFAKHA